MRSAGAEAEVAAIEQPYKVSHMSSLEYAKEVRAGKQPEAVEMIASLHLIDRWGGTSPPSPWVIPRAS